MCMFENAYPIFVVACDLAEVPELQLYCGDLCSAAVWTPAWGVRVVRLQVNI